MEDIISDIGSTPSLEPVTDDNIMDLINPRTSDTSQNQQHIPENPRTDCATEEAPDPAPAARAPKTHPCGFCGQVFRSYPALVEHRSTHGGSRPYECHVCDKRFTQKAHLIIHRRTHTGEKPYACHICHKRFSQTSHLNSHKRVHTGEKPYFCSICNMGFCRRQRLEAHLQQHANDLQQKKLQHGLADTDLQQEMSAQDLQGLALKDLQQGLDVQQGLPGHNSGLGLGMAEAKNLLMSMGLASVGAALKTAESMDNLEHGGTLDAGTGSSKGATSQMAVFPGFDMGEDGGDEDGAARERKNSVDVDSESDHRASRSPTPSSSFPSQNSTTPAAASQSRRKSSFVRKLGSATHSQKTESKADVVAQLENAEESSADGSSCHLSPQEAAVRAMIRMAAGDVSTSNDVAGLDVSMLLKQSLGAGHTNPPTSTPMSVGQSLHSFPKVSPESPAGKFNPSSFSSTPRHPNTPLSSLIRTNTRVSLVDFTAEDLLRHLMSRDDAYRCDFCCVIFQDAAMYHLHRSMHDKMDIRCCNLCGKLLTDKYDFTAHFLSEHK
ncbi:hypothetical protein V1264_003618 [Littorina saxatilis]|uniref:C2H2-type domain-containing protein n=1 Tax=Littorina saxatilis TaxID=31220 RepID=A0AAN9GA61_9CAEN